MMTSVALTALLVGEVARNHAVEYTTVPILCHAIHVWHMFELLYIHYTKVV